MPADKLFVPAAFVGLLADMPPVSAPVRVREAWLASTWNSLYLAVSSSHGLEALRLAHVVKREWRRAVKELAATRAVAA
ncbi:hypothetical protein [Amycolatopsis sp. NPDC059021]|uniref:hypothetical protein n=1 Tax=Amycolatopsis sp. NPDC059021 TaxID=3346704 RepID=UPI003672187D